jgi:Flp pilus assembly protein TadG
MTMWKRLSTRLVTRLVAPLGRDERGAIAVQFALLLIPITILTFGLIDISRASVQKRQLQDALDAATLMAARSTATTNADLDTIGDAALATEMSGLGVNLTASNSTFQLGDDNTVVGTIQNVVIKPIISNLWTTKETPISASSTVMRSVNKLEVALVLDNTGSMASNLGSGGSKINALITASKSLVDVLGAAAARATETDAVKISVVPFSMTVNVGSSYQGQSWLKGTLPSQYGADLFNDGVRLDRFALLTSMGLTWSGCVESRPDPYDIKDDAPYGGDPASYFVPFFAPDEPDSSYKVYKASTGTSTNSYSATVYNDYAKDYLSSPNAYGSETTFLRRQGLTTKYLPTNLRSGANAVDGGPNDGCGITSIMRLTNVRTTSGVSSVKTKLDKMIASGNTNVAMGAMWGWHSISPYAPFADGSAYGAKNTTKVIVLLTDGDNTNDETNNANDSTYSGYGYIWQKRLKDANNNGVDTGSTGTDRMKAIDSRQTKVCAAAQAKGVQIYAIGVGVSSHSKTILQGCATKPEMYYDVTDAAQLTSVFNTIAGSIQNLRITK